MSTLGKVPVSKRTGARVVAPDGLPAEFWGYTQGRIYRDGWLVGGTPEARAWLWRDGALLAPLSMGAARDLRLAGPWFLHPIYRDGVRAATRRDELVLF